MDPLVDKLISMGPLGLFLGFIAYLIMKPPAWAQKWIDVKIESMKREGELLAQIVKGQQDHLLKDEMHHSSLRELIIEQAREDRHDVKNALERVAIALTNSVRENRELVVKTIEASMKEKEAA